MSHADGAATVSSPRYADNALRAVANVTLHERLATDTYRIRFDCPELARRLHPGQFVMLRLAKATDPLLGRPFAFYDTIDDDSGEPRWVDVVYAVVGRMTRRLPAVLPGMAIEVWGPLGNGFAAPSKPHLVLVAGGIGQTPMLALARQVLGDRRYAGAGRGTAERVTLCYGARSAERLAGVADFERAGVSVRIATDDGSVGHRGFVTELLQEVLSTTGPTGCEAVICGPEPMMHAATEVCRAAGVACWVSLETPMACGVGICFSCVSKVRQSDGTWDYRRTCIEGPVFAGESIVWG